jgi:hypothetical protein
VLMDLKAVTRNRSGQVLAWCWSRLVDALAPFTRVNPRRPFPLVSNQQWTVGVGNGVLQDFLQTSQPWSRERVPLSSRLRRTLWALIPVELIWGTWLVTIITGATACDGPICRVATLQHHSAVLLACAVISVTGLVSLIPFTRGLSRSNDRELVGIAAASAAGGIALLGIAALLTGVVIALLLLALFILGFTAT